MINLLLLLALFASTAPSVSVSFECDEHANSILVVTNTSKVVAHVYAYPLSQSDAVTEVEIAPGETLQVPGSEEHVVYLLVGEDWVLVQEGVYPECEKDEPEPVGPPETIQVCRDGELIFTIPEDRHETDTDVCEVVVETTTTTEPPVTPATQPPITTPTTTAPTVSATLTELPFTGAENSYLGLAATIFMFAGTFLLLVNARDA